jgi:hypothetical protein
MGCDPTSCLAGVIMARRGDLAVNGDDKPAFVPALANASGDGVRLSRAFLPFWQAVRLKLWASIARAQCRYWAKK